MLKREKHRCVTPGDYHSHEYQVSAIASVDQVIYTLRAGTTDVTGRVDKVEGEYNSKPGTRQETRRR